MIVNFLSKIQQLTCRQKQKNTFIIIKRHFPPKTFKSLIIVRYFWLMYFLAFHNFILFYLPIINFYPGVFSNLYSFCQFNKNVVRKIPLTIFVCGKENKKKRPFSLYLFRCHPCTQGLSSQVQDLSLFRKFSNSIFYKFLNELQILSSLTL